MKTSALLWLAVAAPATVHAQAIVVIREAWEALSPLERAQIQQNNIVDLRFGHGYGLIIDAQGVDESQPATNGGAILGGAVANAAYIDRAFKPQNNYSAKTQLAVGLLGALIGSSLDRAAVSQFHFRYALRRADGEIEYRDAIQTTAFRHPVGICLDTGLMQPVSQVMCTQTPDDIRRLYLITRAPVPAPVDGVRAPIEAVPPSVPAGGLVQCKLGNLAPVQTSSEKCNLINGAIQ